MSVTDNALLRNRRIIIRQKKSLKGGEITVMKQKETFLQVQPTDVR